MIMPYISLHVDIEICAVRLWDEHVLLSRYLLIPPTGCSRADTLLNVHFVLFFTVFSASRQCCPGGGRGGGQEQLFLRMMLSAFVHLHWFLQCFSRFRTLVFLHHLRFPLVFTVFSGFMTSLMLRHAGVGGDVNVPCNLLTLLMLRHAGVGGDVNVPCNLLTLLMLRHAGVGGMLTFHVTCSCC